jgi:hypothetical protein
MKSAALLLIKFFSCDIILCCHKIDEEYV